ncbi:MAG TPA: hypothetical protein VGP22_07100 [Albitalea sp.]|jgi:hypothetical protein|nr:hypothetical protein [Albitalea sp.]
MSATLPEPLLPPSGLESVGERESDAPEASTTATQRLAASRERMRQWMLQGDRRHEARRRVQAAAEAGDAPAWMDRLRTVPVLGVVIDAMAAWWSHHPLQPAASLARGIVQDAMAPLARRHPIATVFGAFAIGVALVRWRPWRWLAKPALFAGLTTQILTRVVSSVPLDSVLQAFTSFAHRHDDDDDMVHPDAPLESAVAPSTREPAMH